jgi:hypothetical protein
MSKQEIAAMSVKILALYILVNAVITTGLDIFPYVQQQWYAATQGINNPSDFGSIQNMFGRQLISLFFPLIVALLLWKFAGRLGRRMVTDRIESHPSRPAVSAIELQTLIVSVIGLFVLISSIPQFVSFLLALSLPAIPGANFSTILLQLTNPLLYVLLGWFLMFNAARISRYLQRDTN